MLTTTAVKIQRVYDNPLKRLDPLTPVARAIKPPIRSQPIRVMFPRIYEIRDEIMSNAESISKSE